MTPRADLLAELQNWAAAHAARGTATARELVDHLMVCACSQLVRQGIDRAGLIAWLVAAVEAAEADVTAHPTWSVVTPRAPGDA